MSGDTDRNIFRALAGIGAEEAVARGLGARLRTQASPAVVKALAALWLHCAIAAPERTRQIYDAAAEGYIGQPVTAAPAAGGLDPSPETIPADFWDALWDLVDSPRLRQGSLNLLARSPALGDLISTRVQERAAKTAMAIPGVAGAFGQGFPKPFSQDVLSRCSERSLGGLFHESIIAAGQDFAVLDRELPALARLQPPLPYLHARLHQCHRLWQIVGDYEATKLHETAILAFQLAQCGFPPAALRLGVMFTQIVFERPEGAAIMMRTILDAWVHGRRTPPLLAIKWPEIWNLPVEQVRAKLLASRFVRTYPADLFEEAANTV